ncbi:MAG: hypothetical protein IT322_07930 [Anaerolineae bacterium]|nr:hypothetical protein [Anaerolineae bacterium]
MDQIGTLQIPCVFALVVKADESCCRSLRVRGRNLLMVYTGIYTGALGAQWS